MTSQYDTFVEHVEEAATGAWAPQCASPVPALREYLVLLSFLPIIESHRDDTLLGFLRSIDWISRMSGFRLLFSYRLLGSGREYAGSQNSAGA